MVQWLYLAGALLMAAVLFWLRYQFRYQIAPKHLKVTLFGICVRRVALADIESVTKRRSSRAEHWWNTWRPWRRRLVIHRRSGWFKDFVITPKLRYEFKAELEQAVQQCRAESQQSAHVNSV